MKFRETDEFIMRDKNVGVEQFPTSVLTRNERGVYVPTSAVKTAVVYSSSVISSLADSPNSRWENGDSSFTESLQALYVAI